MQKHDEFAVPISLRQFKGFPKSLQLPLHQFLRMFLCLFVPSHDLSAPVKIERAFKGKSLRPNKCIILIGLVAVLQESQARLV